MKGAFLLFLLALGSGFAFSCRSFGASSSPTATPTEGPAAQIERSARQIIDYVNQRQFDKIASLVSARCLRSKTAADIAREWEGSRDRWGDQYQLILSSFVVQDVSQDEADVSATVKVDTATGRIVLGNSADPFFDRFSMEDGHWKSDDPTCS